MPATIVDGRGIAKQISEVNRLHVSRLRHQPRVIAYLPQDPTSATLSYLRIKRKSAEASGCSFEETRDPALLREADAGIVQLPVPQGFSLDELLPLSIDADVLSGEARYRFESGYSDALLPPVVGAIAEILARHHVDPKGKRAVVIGDGFLVGGPAIIWLRHHGAEVDVLTIETGTPPEVLRSADIIISGAGKPRLITRDLIRDGVVLIDAGTADLGGIIVGDADPACAEAASVFTTVPGGVGPIAVACLFRNAIKLAMRKS